MQPGRDPVEQAADQKRDLYEVSTWEPRSRLDRFVVWIDGAVRTAVIGLGLLVVVVLSALVLLAQYRAGQLDAVTDPVVTAMVVLSVVPALVLAAYVWRADVTTGEPLSLLTGTFLLIVLLAGFAAILNELGGYALGVRRGAVGLTMVAFYYVVVGPVEESVKLLAVRLYAYRSERFDAVIDGAVYGAVAGLGFATIENAIYITGALESTATVLGTIEAAGGMTAARALAGPGHVIYSGIAGFYLGLAKFNREYAVPLVLKGLLVAAVIHGTYNTGASVVPPLLYSATGLSQLGAVLAFVVVFDAAAGYYLYRKLRRYRSTYRAVEAGALDDLDASPELTEFDPPTRRSTSGARPSGTPEPAASAAGEQSGRSGRDRLADPVGTDPRPAHRRPDRPAATGESADSAGTPSNGRGGPGESHGSGGGDGDSGDRDCGDEEEPDPLDEWEF